MQTQARSLDGIKVLDLSRLLPGPFLTMVLADLGADVVKVEDPRLGDYLRQIPPARGGMSGRFLAVNRGKRSIAIDLKAPTGLGAFIRMAATADVVIESFRPGVMDRLGVGWSALSAANPRLILCSISGYGQTGPYVERAGHDLNYIGLGGVLAMSGARGGAPAMPGVQIADMAGGGLWGLAGVLAALVGRERTGRGSHVDISMTEGALALLAAEIGNLDAGAEAPTRGTASLNGGLACYGVYHTKDGKYLSVGALEPKFWFAFNAAIGRKQDLSELASPGVQDRVRDEVQAILATRTRDEWVKIFDEHDCCCEPVLEMDELTSHPLHRGREVFARTPAPAGETMMQVRTPLAPARADRPAPALGEHTREVLGEYGFSEAEIAALGQVEQK